MNDVSSREPSCSDVPEAPLASLVKFRPADEMDFGRRAKNLARFLDAPLQDAQEILAKAYGFAHTHELRQRLKVDERAGPYDDRLFSRLSEGTSSLFELTDGYTPREREAAVEQCLSDAEEVKYLRQVRLALAVQTWARTQSKRYRYHLDTMVCDLALFSSPTTHRAAVKKVTEFVQEEGSRGFTDDGYPFGFRGTLHLQYGWRISVASEMFGAFPVTAVSETSYPLEIDPFRQLDLLQRYRAPFLFNAMVEATCPESIESVSLDEYGLEAVVYRERNELLQCDVTDAILDSLEGILDQSAESLSVEDRLRLRVAAAEPAGPEAAQLTIIRDKDAFRETVATLKLALRLAWSRALTGNEGAEYLDRPSKMFAIVERSHADRFMSIQMLPVYTEESIRHWQICAALLVKEEELWKPAGMLTGDFITPTLEQNYADPHSLAQEFAYVGDGTLQDVWKLLTGLYLGRAGFADYHEWINEELGYSVACLTPWVHPAYRGTEVSRWLLHDFVHSFEEYCTSSVDGEWESWVDPRVEDASSDYFPEETFTDPGVVFIPLPKTGILGFSIWEGESETATGQILRKGGQRVGREARRYRGLREDKRTGIGWRLIDAVKETRADFIFFDPDAPQRSSEDED